MHLKQASNLDDIYNSKFNTQMYGDICPYQTYFANVTECEEFVDGDATQGLHTISVAYAKIL